MIRNTFRHKVDILRYGELIPDGGGGGKKTYTVLHSQVACRIIPHRGRQSFTFGKTSVEASHKILIRFLTPAIQLVDRIKYIQSDDTIRNFEVTWILVHSELEKTMRLECLEKDFPK